MKISEMIKQLQEIHRKHGDLPICGGYLSDDRPPEKLCVLDQDGCEWFPGDHEKRPMEVFIE